MKKSVSFYNFEQEFKTYNRNNFSYAGLKALFDYFEQYEDSCGEEIELDVVAICCEYTEYEDVQEFVSAYDDKYVVWNIEPDFEAGEDGEIDYDATLEKIGGYTQVIDIDGESFIIADF